MKRFEGQPFDILGINTDDDKDDYRALCEELGVTWRSSFQGSTAGPLCEQWGISAYPTLFVLDAEGRIRFKDSRGLKLEIDVATLMAELRGEEFGKQDMLGLLQELGYLDSEGKPVPRAGVSIKVEVLEQPDIAAPALVVPMDRSEATEELESTGEAQGLIDEYEAADAAWNAAWRALSGKERRTLKKADPAADFLARFEALDESGSGRAQLWITLHLDDATDLRSKELGAALEAHYTRLIGEHGAGPLAGEIAEALIEKGRRVERSKRAALLEELASRTADRGVAARSLDKAASLLESKKASPEENAHAEELTARLLRDYLDTPEGVGVWGRANKGAYKGVGNKVPDFPAVDTEGKAFRISDYEGQVVLLDFWGFW